MINASCHWGILGAAGIARKNWQAIRDAGNATLVAVASRDRARSAAFIAECQASAPHPNVPLALGGYDELLARPDIDAVYIPLPTGLRARWAIRAAEAGKHVLIEKPAGRNAAEVREIVAACHRHRVQLMDGVMFMHGERLRRMRTVLDDRSHVGEIRHLASQFSFAGDDAFRRENIRTHGELEPLGCLGDLGWYCVRFALWALGNEMPVRAAGCIHREERQAAGVAAVPVEFSGHLHFATGASASFYCSFTAHNAQWALISGTHGVIRVPDFVLPFSGPATQFEIMRSEFVKTGCQFDMHAGTETRRVEEPSNNAPGAPEARMFRAFSELVRSGTPDPFWPDLLLRTQLVIDACLQSARAESKPVAIDGLTRLA